MGTQTLEEFRCNVDSWPGKKNPHAPGDPIRSLEKAFSFMAYTAAGVADPEGRRYCFVSMEFPTSDLPALWEMGIHPILWDGTMWWVPAYVPENPLIPENPV